MNVDPDAPDPSDRTMRRLEMVEAFDELFPRWRSIVASASTRREGWPLGWLDLGTGPGGALIGEAADADTDHQAVTLPWREDRIYCLLRPRQARERWVRVLPRYPLAYHAEAIVLTAPAQADHGMRRWQALTADKRPVMLTDPGGANPRPWLLREGRVYDLDYDIEHGWQVWARVETTAAPWPDPHRPG